MVDLDAVDLGASRRSVVLSLKVISRLFLLGDLYAIRPDPVLSPPGTQVRRSGQ